MTTDGPVETSDEDAIVSAGDDPGAWVTNEQAGVKTEEEDE